MAILSGSRRTLLRFVDPESSTVEIFSVHRLLRGVGMGGVRELHEREAPRSPGLAISDDVARIDGTVLLEFVSKETLTRLERQVAHVKFLTQCHVLRCTQTDSGNWASSSTRCAAMPLTRPGPRRTARPRIPNEIGSRLPCITMWLVRKTTCCERVNPSDSPGEA